MSVRTRTISRIIECSFNNLICSLIFTGEIWYGVDITKEDIEDNFKACVWEPAVMKINALSAATEAACLIMSIDETIKSPQSSSNDMSANNPYK